MSNPIQFIRASKSEEGTQLWVTGEIGVDVRFADLQRALTHYVEGSSEIILNIYSHGGYLDDATAFYDWIADSGTKFKVRIWGTAMSAATVIAAAAGRANIEIAPNATWMIHETQGGTDEMRSIGNDSLVRVYRTLTGKKEKEIREMIAATTTLNATEAVKHGFAGKVMKSSMRLAAMYEAQPIEINDKTPAMADNKTIKVQAQVKLATMDAARAAFSAEGVTTEVEVNIEQATVDALAAKDVVIAEKEAELATLKAEQEKAVEVAQAEAVTNAQQEAVTAKADLAPATEAHTKAIDALKAEHDAAIKALKAPIADPTVANNQAAAVAAMPGAVVSESDKAAANFRAKNTTALDVALSAKKEVPA